MACVPLNPAAIVTPLAITQLSRPPLPPLTKEGPPVLHAPCQLHPAFSFHCAFARAADVVAPASPPAEVPLAARVLSAPSQKEARGTEYSPRLRIPPICAK